MDSSYDPNLKQNTFFQKLIVSFKQNLNYYNLFWVFFICGILGYCIEMLFTLATTGIFQSRQGLLYGPFTQIYGVGAVLLVLLLKPLGEKKAIYVYLGGALVGGAFEYFASWMQQAVLHANSWNYAHHWGSIGDRTSIPMILVWGLLGLVFIKFIYPMLEKIIRKIPKRLGVILAAVFSILLAIDIGLSAGAVYRWSRRESGASPNNTLERFFDNHYDNDYMEKVYPNLTIQK